jgi:hypothetical protein
MGSLRKALELVPGRAVLEMSSRIGPTVLSLSTSRPSGAKSDEHTQLPDNCSGTATACLLAAVPVRHSKSTSRPRSSRVHLHQKWTKW